MLRLRILEGSSAGQEFPLAGGGRDSLMLGRGRECGARFDEPTVSARHAMIAVDGPRFYLLDQRSENGTYVNGARVEQMRLRNGDLITLGADGPRLQVTIDDFATGRLDDATTARLLHTTERIQGRVTTRWPVSEGADPLTRFHPQHDSGKSLHSARALVMFVACAALGMMVLGLVVADLGVQRTVLSGLVSLVSVAVYLAIFLWLDRYDPEPLSTLAVAFGWGATFAVLVAVIANNTSDLLIGSRMTTILSAPFTEEALKGAGVLLIALFFRRDFDSIVDGIVYAGVVALGFATVENIEYYGNSPAPGQFLHTFFLRGVLSPFSHVLFTCMTGIGVGVARETHRRLRQLLAPVVGFVAAVALHMLWNFLAIRDLTTFFAGYVLLEMPIFLCFVCAIAFIVHREGLILTETLAREVERGLISQQQLDIAISVFRRTGWLLAASHDRALFNRRRRFLRAVAKLGLCHWHKARAAEAHRNTGSFPLIARLQGEVFSLRDTV